MKILKNKFATIALIAVTIFAAQVGTLTSAFAADAPTDLSITVEKMGNWNVFAYRVCNNGPTDVIAFTVENTFTNFSVTQYQNVIFAETTANSSNIDLNTGDWTGQMTSGQCVEVFVLGNVTGSIGQNLDMTSTITSATLSDSTENVDTNIGDETATTPASSIIEQADLAMETRLLTEGTITSGMTVRYELQVKNIGVGDYTTIDAFNFGQPQIYVLMPAGASFVNLIDSNTGDILDIDSCFPVGNIEDQLPGSGYTGVIQGCQLAINSGDILPSGSSYKFELQVLTTAGFVSGDTEVFGISIGNDENTILYFARLSLGEDFLATPINNIFRLTFDDTSLVPTINPCAGQGAVVSTSSACFTISFNKSIFGDSFTIDDLVLTGTGTIDSLTRVGANEWTVVISGLQLGSQVTLTLSEAAIQDLSAIYNGTQVLGINTIRYGETTSTTPKANSASGTLANTGNDSDWGTPFGLLFAGLILLGLSKKKNKLSHTA